MSIFKSTFPAEITGSINARQEAIQQRNVQYLNSRNVWIRMTSSVNVNKDDGALAKKYILQGGVLSNGALGTFPKAGVGTSTANAYSSQTSGGETNLRGLRPMPGITSIEIKSKSFYGSLRDITVNFQCWDIKQLEELELLYMRPGYTALVEWGWFPYLDNTGKIVTSPIQFYDILNKKETDRTEIFKDLYNKSKASGGNYDAMYGYIKNYSWSARPDGGFDCQTNIISTGEIIESLKINYIRPDLKTSVNSAQMVKEVIGAEKVKFDFSGYYSKNVIAGLLAEVYEYVINPNVRYFANGKIFDSKKVLKLDNAPLGTDPQEDKNSLIRDNHQVYITLGMFFDILNEYVIIHDPITHKPIVELSLDSSTITSDGDNLLCIAHPLQVSVDPTVCLIKSPIWSNGGFIGAAETAANNKQYQSSLVIVDNIYNDVINGNYEIAFSKIDSISTYNILNDKLIREKKGTLQEILKKNLFADAKSLVRVEKMASYLKKNTGLIFSYGVVEVYEDTRTTVGTVRYSTPNQYTRTIRSLKENSIILPTPTPTSLSTANTIINSSKQAIANINLLQHIPLNYFYDGDQELGIIKNIYVNVNYLYKLSLSQNLESKDNKERNEINLYDYLKSIIRDIQTSIGNLNSFDIHVDPTDNKVAKIIDINYTEPLKGKDSKNTIYNSLFELQVHNLQSVVRSYSMQSQIFPDQSSIIAIGAQAKGGQLGIQNNTMIDFNRNLIDRITPEKTFPVSDGLYNNPIEKDASVLNNALATIVEAFSVFNQSSNNNNKSAADNIALTQQGSASELFNAAKNSLRDVIVYFQSITSSTSRNRNIIPIKFSFELDGIGGLVIGNMFKLPKFAIPKGYRGDDNNIGVQLGQAITTIGHTISNNDWVTKIEALNIVLNDNNVGKIPFSQLDLKKIFTTNFTPSNLNKYDYDLIRTKSLSSPTLSTENAQALKNNLIINKIAKVNSGELILPIEEDLTAIVPSLFKFINAETSGSISLTVTSANDKFHNDQAGFSNHQIGRALDFTISPYNETNRAKVWNAILKYQKAAPELRALDEYSKKSENAKGGHFHISYKVLTTGA